MKEKTIQVGGGLRIDALMNALSKCNDNDYLQVKLVVKGSSIDNNAEVVRLKTLCNRLFWALLDAMPCIDYCVDEENKTGTNAICYSSKLSKPNEKLGAHMLADDISKLLDDYHKEMVDIDLMK